ncbi:MAG: hypothetical protein ABJ004_19370 [Cyclobacteriaceae bacterium]
MKNIALLIVVVLGVSLLSGCKKDKERMPDDPSVSIGLGEIGTSIAVLESINIELAGAFPAGLKSAISVIKLDDAPLDTIFSVNADTIITSISEAFPFNILPGYSGSNLKITFYTLDQEDRIAADSVSVFIEESAINTIEGTTIAGYNNFTLGSFFDLQKDTVYFSSNIQNSTNLKKSVDLVFFFTKDDKRILAAPSNGYSESVWSDQSNALWPLFGSENETLLYDLGTNVSYDEIITGAQIASIFAEQTTSTDSLIGVQSGQFIGVQLSASRGTRQGIIKVLEVGGDSPSSATITIDAKVQQ